MVLCRVSHAIPRSAWFDWLQTIGDGAAQESNWLYSYESGVTLVEGGTGRAFYGAGQLTPSRSLPNTGLTTNTRKIVPESEWHRIESRLCYTDAQ